MTKRLIVNEWDWLIRMFTKQEWREPDMKRVPLHLILDSMTRYWGGFAKKLCEALELADRANAAKIIETWSDMIIWHLHLNWFD